MAMTFRRGLKDGIPICLGYISVSFTFGMMVVEKGFSLWLAVLISMTNLTSAGQFAGFGIIAAGGGFAELAITTLIINLRYMLMSFSLSQKVEPDMSVPVRMGIAYGITDEIFAVSMQQHSKVNAKYFTGLMFTPYFGWTLGTLVGAGAAQLLPESLRLALGIAIYGMFLAIIIPPARKSKAVLSVISFAAILSCVFRYVPILLELSSGWVIIICAVVTSALGAWIFPVKDSDNEEAVK